MVELIHELTTHLISADGVAYHVWVLGEKQADGAWQGWIEFHPVGAGAVLATRRETSQLSRGALYYWAGRLEPQYFENALLRAAPASQPFPADEGSAGSTGASSSIRTPLDARHGC